MNPARGANVSRVEYDTIRPEPLKTHTFRCSDREWEEISRLALRQSIELGQIVGTGNVIRSALQIYRVAEHRRLDKGGVPDPAASVDA